MTLFLLKIQTSFWSSKIVRLVQKKWKEVETNFKQFQSVAFFSLKKSFWLLLFFVLHANMRSLWTWPFFCSKFRHPFEVPNSLDLVKRCHIGYYHIHNIVFFTSGCDVFVMTGCDNIRDDKGWLAHFFQQNFWSN